MPVVLQVESLDSLLDYSLDLACLDSFDQSVELDGLFNGELGEYRIVLGAVANKLSGILEL